jgi:ribosome-associated protein
MARDLPVTPGLALPAAELSWVAVRASGPGGQNVNKVSSKVELRFDFESSRVLGAAVKARLRALAGARLDAAGRIVIVSQATRNQPQNLEDAREKLAALVRRALVAPKRRRATKPSRAARESRLVEKRRRSETKRTRRQASRDD